MKYKYTTNEKEKLHSKYYDDDGFVLTERIGDELVPLKDKAGLYSKWSTTTDDIRDNDRYVYDVLELDGKNCIRFNITKYFGCACNKYLMDKEDLEHLRDFLNEYLPKEE